MASGDEYLLYNELKLDATLSNTEECFNSIRDIIITKLILNEVDPDNCIQVQKKSQIQPLVSHITQKLTHEQKPILLYSYGQHIHRQISVLEVVKTKLREQQFNFHQYNNLSCLVQISQGRNELLQKKINIPVMLIIIASKELIMSLEGFQKQ
ncbi:HFL013Wp [Eremothecium sinecaudum]|uniref:HFL013Wp n=1 Tax=Eremothecium sinecaudum TaxID=45286 RepID=A0A109V058_9SACH|nr:HFL013Wp [Eremothecium sinecaudum]AMD21843.1 HFL013Wp [Eremothecium sinecaudum]